MERRFFMNDFEQSLKEQADKFQMVPSKKVWHGIYNDLHPGKRWPSVTMSLLLVFTLVVIGHLNTNNSRRLAYVTDKTGEAKKSLAGLERAHNSKNNHRVTVRKTDLDKGREIYVYQTGQANSTGNEPLQQSSVNNDQNDIAKNSNPSTGNLKSGNTSSGLSSSEENTILNPQLVNNSAEYNTGENGYNTENRLQNGIMSALVADGEAIDKKTSARDFNKQPVDRTSLLKAKTPTKKEELSSSDKDKNINAAISTKMANPKAKIAKLHKKRNEKISWVYFVAPVVNSVSFNGEPVKQGPSTNFTPGLTGTQKEYKVIHHSALGFEAGTQMNYSLTKKLQFTVGTHLTYSGYNIVSNEVHPTFATLRLIDPENGMTYSKSFITHYGDGNGQTIITIHNYNWQLSLPVGLQYAIAGNDKMQLNLGADVEPSLVLKSKAYILSSDGNNYLEDPSIIRKWNLNSNFGAFVTFSSRKLKWQVGPNIRYQWLSTYKKDYTIKEHLIDYGVRIGISR